MKCSIRKAPMGTRAVSECRVGAGRIEDLILEVRVAASGVGQRDRLAAAVGRGREQRATEIALAIRSGGDGFGLPAPRLAVGVSLQVGEKEGAIPAVVD